MEDHELDELVKAIMREIDRKLGNPGEFTLICEPTHEVDGMLGILEFDDPEHTTFLSVMCGEDGDLDFMWAEDHATDLFFRYIMEFGGWSDPMTGAVTPDLSEFFAWCDPTAPALLHWSRWLRIHHANDAEVFTFDQALMEMIVEAAIHTERVDAPDAALMRRAVRGEPVGERDPNQLDLF